MSTALILHAYSRDNAGDGLLVDESVALVTEALGDSVEITLVSSRPESFADTGYRLIDGRPTARGYSGELLGCLRRAGDFDVVVGVGGGYLRGGHPRELLTTALVHFPQLWAATRVPQSVYLSQSIGPFRFGSRRLVNRLLRRVTVVMVRDDRSLQETGRQCFREPDLAILSGNWLSRSATAVDPRPVLSVRAVRGALPTLARQVADNLPEYDTFIQSRVGSNDDVAATGSIHPVRVLEPTDLFDARGRRRVVVAVRLHAALMALQAGHYVIHLSYERKGFGAFGDLGLSPYVHNSRTGDRDLVLRQVRTLLNDPCERMRYDERLDVALKPMVERRNEVVDLLRSVSRARTPA